MTGRFVGREREQTRLATLVDAGATAAVVGPAGIGKSALVRSVMAERPHRVGGGLTMLLQRPYVALEAAVRANLGGDPEEVASQVLAAVDGVLVVEDLHWVHRHTVEVLALLAGELPIVVTTRHDTGDGTDDILRRAAIVRLDALPERAADQLARRLHPDLDDQRRRELLDLAAGNPLLIEQLVGDRQRISPTLEAAITDRLRSVDATARRALGILALIGRPAPAALVGDLDTVQDLVRRTDDGNVELRHAALTSSVTGLLRDEERRWIHVLLADELDDAEGAAHDLAAGRPERAAERASRAARDAAHVLEQALLHRLAAQAREAAGDDADEERVRAAEAFVDAGSWTEAIEQVGRIRTDRPALASDAALQEGRARWSAGDVDAARASFERAAELASASGDEARRARVLVDRAYLEVRARVPGSLQLARDALAEAERTGVAAARARANLGAALLYEGDPTWSDVLEDALAGAEAAGDVELEAATAFHLSSGLGFHGRFEESLALGRRMVARTGELGLGRWRLHFEAAALVVMAHNTVTPVEVVADADRLLPAARVFRNRFQLHIAKVLGLVDLGRFAEARDALDLQADERHDDPDSRVAVAAMTAELAWHLDDVDLARRALARGRDVPDGYFGIHLLTERTAGLVLAGHGESTEPVLPAMAMPAWWAALDELEAVRLLVAGDPRAAATAFDRAARQWASLGTPRWEVRAAAAAADALAEVGDRSVPDRRRRYAARAREAGLVGTLRRLGLPVHPELTRTEEDLLRAVARGATTRAVAAELGISAATVDQHIESARRKLGAATRLEAALQVGE